jgi:hypothetical protein
MPSALINRDDSRKGWIKTQADGKFGLMKMCEKEISGMKR